MEKEGDEVEKEMEEDEGVVEGKEDADLRDEVVLEDEAEEEEDEA